jgi:hypothetical protein
VSSSYIVRNRGLVGWYRPEMDSTVTSDLMQPQAERQAARPRRARRLAPVLTVAGIAAVAAVAVGVTAITTSGDGSAARPNLPASHASTAPSSSAPGTPMLSTSAPSTSAPNTSAPSTSAPARRPTPTTGASGLAPVLLRNGAQQGRAQVPWSRVGPGWFLAVTDGAAPGLYLINPIGGRYLITDHLPNAEDRIAQWSPDGKRVMLIRAKGASHIITELELATGRILHTVNLGERGFFGYTRPQGRAILVIRDEGTSSVLERLGADGRLQLTYPRTLPGFGEIGFPVLYNADGTELLVGGRHGMALLGNDGQLIRTLPAPAGVRGCWPVRWWSSSTVLETCVSQAGNSYALFLQPVAGGQPEELAAASKAHPGGFSNAWRYSEGTLLSEGAGCGPGKLNVLRDGVIRALELPAGVAEYPPVIGVDGDLLTLRRLGGCPIGDEGSVISLNLVTGAATTLFKGDAQLIPYPWQ